MRRRTPRSPIRGTDGSDDESYGEGSFESFSSPQSSPLKGSKQKLTKIRGESSVHNTAFESDGENDANEQSNDDSQAVAGMDLETFMGNYKVRAHSWNLCT